MLLGRYRFGLLAYCVAVVGYCAGTPFMLLFLATAGSDHPQHGGMLQVIVGFVWLAVSVALGVATWLAPFRRYLRRRQTSRAAGPLGLSMLPNPNGPLRRLSALPLLRFPGRRGFACAWAMEGILEGRPLVVFDLRFQGAWRDGAGRRREAREEQTVAAVEGAGPLADFHLGPADEWDVLAPHWPAGLGLFRRRHFPGMPAPVRARDDETLDGLFGPARRAELAVLGDYVVECSGGTLLVYRLDRRVSPESLADFLRDVARVVHAFRDVAGLPPPEPGTQMPAPETEAAPEPPRPMPLSGHRRWAEKLATCLMPAGVGLVVGGGAEVARLSGATGLRDNFLSCFMLVMGAVFTLLLFATQYDWVAYVQGWLVWREGRRAGLRPERPSCELGDLPLFRLLDPHPVSATWWLRGDVGGHDVCVVDLDYRIVHGKSGGEHVVYRRRQTAAVMPGLGPNARFRVGPGDKLRDAVFHAWPARQGLTLRYDLGDVEVYANLDAGLSGLTPERIEALASFTGWAIEGAGGMVQVYRPGVRVPMGEMARFLETVRRIADALHGQLAPPTADRPPSPSQDGIIRPTDGVEARPDETG